MKNLMFISLAVLLTIFVFNTTANAQMSLINMEKYIKLGINIANVNGDDADNTDSKTGLIGGFGMKFGLGGMIAVQPEILYTKKGYKVDMGNGDVSINLDYVEIPVLAKLNMPMIPGFYAGPALAFNTAAEDEDGNEIENVKGTDFGLVLGADYALPIGTMGKAILDARYTMGMSTIDDSDADLSIKNSVFSIMAGYAF